MKGNIPEEQLIATRKKVGKHFKDAREAKGWNQEQAAEEMGMSRSTISKVEAGNWNMGLDTLTLFCHHLDITSLSFTQE